MEKMMNLLGGLYKDREGAQAAFGALREAGFQEEDITMLIRKPVRPPEFESRASAKDVVRSAGIGVLIVGPIGVFLALLVGLGVIPIQGIIPSFETGDLGITLTLTLITLFISAVTVAILGVAIRLKSSPEGPEITSKGVKRGGMLIVVSAEETQVATVDRVMKTNGAVDVENLTDKWDPEVWSRYEGAQIPSAN
jgi:hypothetical protein